MADALNLIIRECLNVELPNLRGNGNWEDKTSKLIYIKGEIWDSIKLRANIELTNDKRLANFLNFDSSRNWKNSENLLIFQFGKSKIFPIWKIPKIFTLENSKNSYNWRIFSKSYNSENPHFTVWKIIKYLGCLNNFKKMKEWIRK